MDKFNIKVGEKELAIVTHEIKKGQTKGATFWGPDFNALDLNSVVAAFGEDKVLNDIVIPELRRLANIITKEAVAEVTGKDKGGVLEGTEQQEQFIQRFGEMYSGLSPRGLTIKALKERINELTEELSGIKPVFGAGGMPDVTNSETIRFFKLAQKLQAAQCALEAKKSKDEEDSGDNAEAPKAAPAVA
jgi:hypothetical protein